MGHVRYGLDFLETWSLPSMIPTPSRRIRPWVNHEWLSEALMAAAYQLSGNAGLIALKVLVARHWDGRGRAIPAESTAPGA